MSNELQCNAGTGLTLDAYVLGGTAGIQRWYTVTPAFETFNSAHWTSYALAMTEMTGTGFYYVSFPTGIATAGRYGIEFRSRANPATAAITDPVIASRQFDWTGSAEVVYINGPFKINTANNFSVWLVQSSDNKTPYTSPSSLACTVSKAGGAAAAIGGTITQVGSTAQYRIAGVAADFNATDLLFAITATGANSVYVNVNTTP